MSRKPVLRVTEENPPPYICNECWYYESQTQEHGSCYATPPQVIVDDEGDWACPRPIVMAEDRGCIHWKARHTA